jgi:hypothetical protein
MIYDLVAGIANPSRQDGEADKALIKSAARRGEHYA